MNRIIPEENNGGGFDLKRLAIKLARNYKWLLLSVFVFIGGAYMYLRYTVPLYMVTSFVQVQQPGNSTNLLVGSPFAPKPNAITNSMPDINSEMFKLQSAALIGEVVDSMNLTMAVMEPNNIRKEPVLLSSLPYEISIGKFIRDKENEYHFILFDSSFRVSTAAGTVTGPYNWPVIIQQDTITVRLKHPLLSGQKLTCRVSSSGRAATIARYLARFSISPVPKGGAGMLQLSMRDEIPQRAKNFLEVLIHRYDQANLIFKNKALRSEMEFLDNRLATVNEELEKQENNVRDFKAYNKINDVSASANQLLTSLNSIDTKKSDNEYKARLISLVEKNVNAISGQEERINVPGLQDADLLSLVGKYNDLVAQQNNVLVRGTPNDLRLERIRANLQDTKNGIQNRIKSIRAELNTSNAFLQSQESTTTGRFVTLPAKEKDYIQVNRLLNIKQTLYIFLLQRKEDMNIQFASSGMEGTRFVDWRMYGHTQNPQPLMVYLVAVAAGLIIPAVVIITRFLLNKRIETSQEIYKATTLPIAGEIAFDRKNKKGLLVTETGGSPVAEQFRTLRTNIFYFNKGTDKKVLLVTSATSGEGKSFISLNLAHTIAISGKKTVLLEFDLRNPVLSEKLGRQETAGITNFLENTTSIEQIIHPVPEYTNLSFISAGHPFTDNPGEVILSNRMQQLFDHLRRHFDFIVVDTPPIEMVSDALTLARWADCSLFVIRHKYSLRSSLALFNQLHEDNKLPHPVLVINGIIPGDGFNNVYGYGYGYQGGHKKKKAGSKLKIA
jgi:tyrosine-protein kinase Etk/Wzc